MRNKQYHEIDKIELHGTRIAVRTTSRIRAKLIEAFKQHKFADISNDLFNDIFLPLMTASLLADLRGRKRSFLFADTSFNAGKSVLPELQLAFGKKAKKTLKRVVKLPVKKIIKKGIINVSVENIPEDVTSTYKKAKKIYKGGK